MENNNTKNNSVVWLLLVGVVVFAVMVLLWVMHDTQVHTKHEVVDWVRDPQVSEQNSEDLMDPRPTAPLTEAQEEKRLQIIEDSRQELLKEQAYIQAELEQSTSSEEEMRTRQEEINSELQDLQNQKDYPPLASPVI